MKAAIKIMSVVAVFTIFLSACQNNQNTSNYASGAVKIENIQPAQDGAFPEGIDTSNIDKVAIQNMNLVHLSTTYSMFKPDQADIEEAVQLINNSTWNKSKKTYKDVCSLKGQYMMAFIDVSNNMKYAIMMNETVIPDLDKTTYNDIKIDNSKVDQSVAAYLVEQSDGSLNVYETTNKQVYDYIDKLGQAYQEDRVPTELQAWTSNEYAGTEIVTFEADLPNKVDSIESLDKNTELGIDIQNYIISYFNNEQPNLAQKLDPYEETTEEEYRYAISITDQNNSPAYVVYLTDNATKMLDCLTGNCWISGSEQLHSSLMEYIEEMRS